MTADTPSARAQRAKELAVLLVDGATGPAMRFERQELIDLAPALADDVVELEKDKTALFAGFNALAQLNQATIDRLTAQHAADQREIERLKGEIALLKGSVNMPAYRELAEQKAAETRARARKEGNK